MLVWKATCKNSKAKTITPSTPGDMFKTIVPLIRNSGKGSSEIYSEADLGINLGINLEINSTQERILILMKENPSITVFVRLKMAQK